MIRMFRRSSSPAVDDPSAGQIRAGGQLTAPGRQILGRLVAVRRARLGLTRADLAQMMNLSPRNVTSIEEGRASSDEMLKRLAAVLGVDRRTEGLRSTFGARWLLAGTAPWPEPPSPRGARHTLTAQPAKPLDHIRSRRADRIDRDHRADSDHG